MSDIVMIPNHEISWFLKRNDAGSLLGDPSVFPEAELTCNATDGSPCRHGGPWAADMDPGEFHLFGECWATVWIESVGAEKLWMGKETRQVEGTRCLVWWDGADWVWAYEGEDVVLPEEQIECDLDHVETGIVELNHRVDDVHATLDVVESHLHDGGL